MILTAALKVKGFGEKGEDVVVPCFRHGNGYTILHNLCKDDSYKGHVVEGFIDNNGEFLDRTEALLHANMCGQLSATTRQYKQEHKEDELYSEDLY